MKTRWGFAVMLAAAAGVARGEPADVGPPPCAGLDGLAFAECQHYEAARAKRLELERRRAAEAPPTWTTPISPAVEMAYRACGPSRQRAPIMWWIAYLSCVERAGVPMVIANCGSVPVEGRIEIWARFERCLMRAGVITTE